MRNADFTQNVIVENRERLTLSGVESVTSFDENEVVLETVKGTVLVRGSGMHMEKLNTESGEVRVEGMIDGVEYEDAEPQSGGFWSRLFR